MSWRKGLLLLFAIIVGSMDGLPLNVCTSEVCKFEANRIKGNIDNSVAPCDNFYQFACGNYNPVISEEKLEVNACTEQQDLINSQLYKLMSEKIMETDIHPIKLVKNFFQSCMDTETINKIGLKHVVEKMIQLGGWPVVKSHGWNESSWSYQNFIQFAELQGIIPNYYFFSLSVGQNPKNKTKMILKLEQAKLLLNRAFLIKGLNSSVMQAYHSYQIDLAVLYGADRNDAEKEMKDVLDFEITFAKIAQLEETYELVTVAELQMIFPSLRWLDYMNAFLPKDKQITENEEVKISSKIVFLNIHKLLSRTSKRVLANYVMWRIAFKTSPYMSDDIQQRLLKFLKNITDEKNDEPRWKLCESRTSYFLDLAYSAIYVRKYFNEKSKYDVMELVESIKEQFKSTIEATEWMDEKTKNKAIEKLLNMKNYTGYVDDLKDDKKLIEFYKDLDFNNKEFFKSYLKIIQFNRKKIFSLFRESVNETDLMLYSDVTEVNAFYAPTLNSILFPAGFLQGQIFSADRPKYMNYGSIGWVIGHEITHGFDNKGCQFNANGEKVNWWQNGTLSVYNKKIQCISYQYGNYTEPSTKLKLNGTKTLGENIADNGGILLSYKAYQKWIKENKEEPILPDLNFTSNQLFWISAAQTWCSKTRPETMKLIIATDTHSPPLFRVNGAFSNTLEFSNDFKCPESSAMNRKNKCKVW